MSSTNGHGSKTAILYARVSTDEQARSGFSLAQQMEARMVPVLWVGLGDGRVEAEPGVVDQDL